MRISDWSSDVCSSDLPWRICPVPQFAPPRFAPLAEIDDAAVEQLLDRAFGADRHARTAYKVRDGTTPIAALSLALVEDGTLLGTIQRSEEHTSELQSLMRISYAVFCLKNKKTHHKHSIVTS